MEASENKPRGRPPLCGPGTRPGMFGVHINMSSDIWEGVEKHAEAIGEPSLSHVARKLLRERLTQLGCLRDHQIRPLATEAEAATFPGFLMGFSCQLSPNISSDYGRVGRGFWAPAERVAIPLRGAVVRLYGTGLAAKKKD